MNAVIGARRLASQRSGVEMRSERPIDPLCYEFAGFGGLMKMDGLTTGFHEQERTLLQRVRGKMIAF